MIIIFEPPETALFAGSNFPTYNPSSTFSQELLFVVEPSCVGSETINNKKIKRGYPPRILRLITAPVIKTSRYIYNTLILL